jgi:mRNA-degrading endonuclease YafQ of YafQ-DinJ toxin-antitoxin module
MAKTVQERLPGWRISESSVFRDSLVRNTRIFSDLPHRLAKFIEVKIADPLSVRYGKHDRRLTGDLGNYYHCHLRDDAVLIYGMKNKTISLVYIAPHAEIQGKRLKCVAKKLEAA